ncbi:hypothetical protein [Megasphaera sp.]|uniref:hypothetical protein n=1 Tax=Megasphaera sp. TaxID=2023260 RepID=UPI003FEF2ECA
MPLSRTPEKDQKGRGNHYGHTKTAYESFAFALFIPASFFLDFAVKGADFFKTDSFNGTAMRVDRYGKFSCTDSLKYDTI